MKLIQIPTELPADRLPPSGEITGGGGGRGDSRCHLDQEGGENCNGLHLCGAELCGWGGFFFPPP